MKIKQKILSDRQKADKQYSQKVQNSQSTPLLFRLQKEYLLNKENQLNYQNASKANKFGEIAKNTFKFKKNNLSQKLQFNNENIHVDDMNNAYYEDIYSHNQSHLDIQPKSLQNPIQNDSCYYQKDNQYMAMTQSQENINYKKVTTNFMTKFQNKKSRYESINFEDYQHRPLTFGVLKNCSLVSSQTWQPNHLKNDIHQKGQKNNCSLLNSQEYIQEKLLKESVLNEIISRKNNANASIVQQAEQNMFLDKLTSSQQMMRSKQTFKSNSYYQTMINSVNHSVEKNLNNVNINKHGVNFCLNHPHKKAKYRVLNFDSDQQVYCSKCAINFLQQGFSIEQLKKQQKINVFATLPTNSHHQTIRTKQLKQFQEKIVNVQTVIQQKLGLLQELTDVSEIEYEIQKVQKLYEAGVLNLTKRKNIEMNNLLQMKKNIEKKHKQQQQDLICRLTTLGQLKKQLKQYNGKFIQMKQNQYQFLLQSFVNKVESYEKLPQIKQHFHQNQNNRGQIQKLITELYYSLINNENEISFERKTVSDHSDDFYCQQIKQPFRNLFPDEESEDCGNTTIKNYERDSPRFNKCFN